MVKTLTPRPIRSKQAWLGPFKKYAAVVVHVQVDFQALQK
jgi:hypothetical protein